MLGVKPLGPLAKLLQMLVLLVLVTLPSMAMASWRYVAVTPEVEAMRFNTIDQAHSFMVGYLTAQEFGTGTYLSDDIRASTRGEYVSRVCFLHLGADGDYDPVSCTGSAGTTYRRSKFLVPAELDHSPFLDLDAGEPSTTMCVGNPIHLGTGNKFQVEPDYQSGGPDPLVFTRYYNSSHSDAPFGGWTHTYSRSVDYSPEDYGENMVVVHRPDGQRLAFYLNGSSWAPSWATDDKLAQTETGWRYTGSTGVVEHFDLSGRLLRIEHPNGNHHELTYSDGLLASVEDSYNRTMEFEHSLGDITGLIDLAGELIKYHYDSSGRLEEVTYQDGATRTYLYDDLTYPGLLSGIIDERGNRFATWEYDSLGRAIVSERAGGADRTTITYNDDGSVDVTNALGHVQTYTFSRKNGALTVDSVEGAPCAGFAGGTEHREYNSNGLLTAIIDRAGNKWTYRHNSRGLETSRINERGANITTSWHPEFSLPVKITSPTSITEYTYDERLRVTSTTVIQRTPRQSRTWTYTYHPDVMGIPGRLASVDGPRDDVSDVTSFTYNLQGYLTRTTNALGHTTQYQFHDDHGRATRIVDPNGVVRTMAYDLRGRLVSTTGPEGTATYTYDEAGLLVALTKPNGSVETYQYDNAHRLLARVDGNGNRHAILLDALGNPVQERLLDAAAQTHWMESREFSEMGWLLAVTDAYNNQTMLDYDLVQNLVGEVSPEGNVFGYEYDRYQRQTRIIDPLGGNIQLGYASSGALSDVTDPRSRKTSYKHNGYGEVSEIRSPDAGNTYFTYDAAGNLATRTDAKGQVVSYFHDALNRLTMVSSSVSGEPAILYGYDSTAVANGIGRLTSVSDGNGIRTFGYTPEGLLAYEKWDINGKSFTTSYEYDGAGLLLKIHYPRGREVAYHRNAAGEVVNATTRTGFSTRNVATQISRLPFGPVASMTRSNGLVETRHHDLSYRTTEINVPGVHQLTYDYTPDSNISSISDLLDGTLEQGLGYDRLGRLVEAEGLYGLLGYGYDATGNRTSLTVDGQSQSYSIRFNNNWLLNAGGVANSYDSNGNLVERGGDTFAYDSFNRLTSATVSGTTATYGYNHLNQRVTKTLNGHTRLLLYDQAGNLISELDGTTGAVLAEYIWLDGTPLAYIELGQLYHIHTDHLGTPKALTDITGTVVWKADYSPFGQASITSQGLTFNLRFPGQYYDAETGLHYNWNRYYDPGTGRYITSDPIGLAGGINTYAYAHSNPFTNIDPYGLWSVSVELFLGVGGGVSFAYSQGTLEMTGKVGVGVGGGWSLDIDGTPSPHSKSCGSDYIARTITSIGAGMGVGPLSYGASAVFATGNGFVESDLKTGAYSTITDPITMAKGRSVGGRWGAHIAAEMGSYTNW